MTSPQPMQVRRRGAKRGDHGTYVVPAAAPAETTPAGPIGTDTTRLVEPTASSWRRRTAAAPSDATARAKAAYDARPKVIFRGVDEDTNDKLRAIYKHQLHQPDGIEGWSEWGRTILAEFVAQYERTHGEMTGGGHVELHPGRVAGS